MSEGGGTTRLVFLEAYMMGDLLFSNHVGCMPDMRFLHS